MLAWGPAGVGKSALLAKHLSDRGDHASQRARWLRVEVNDHPNALMVAVARVLCGRDAIGGLGREELAAAIIDHLDASALTLMVDDLDHADYSEAEFLLDALATYLRRGKLIATSNTLLQLPPTASSIAVGALARPELVTLASRLRESDDEQSRVLAEHAGGSPWRLRRLVEGKPADEDDDITSMIAGNPFLAVLALVGRPLREEAIAAAGIDVPTQEMIDSWTSHGILERSFGGLTIHRVARGFLREQDVVVEGKLELARALAASDDDAAIVSGLILLLDESASDGEVSAVLETRAQQLIESGFAEELCAHIQRSGGAGLDARRIRLAEAVRAFWAIDDLEAPPGDSVELALAWVRLARVGGKLKAASDVLAKIELRHSLRLKRSTSDSNGPFACSTAAMSRRLLRSKTRSSPVLRFSNSDSTRPLQWTRRTSINLR